MVTLSWAERCLRDKVCLHCQGANLSLVLCLGGDSGEYLCVAYCHHCQARFSVEGDCLEAMRQAQVYVTRLLCRAVCPHCNRPDFSFEFGCDVVNGYCFFKVICCACGHGFWVVENYTHLALTRLQ